MLRVLSPLGNLAEVRGAVPVAEKEIVFNGRKKRFFEKAQGFAQKPTGIVFYLRRPSGYPMMVSETHLYVGNMRPEKVQSLMREILERGYCDLSTMEYQPSKRGNDQVIDGGESPAYSSETTPCSFPAELVPLYGFGGAAEFGGMEFFGHSEPDGEEGFSDGEDGEDR